MKTLKVLKFVGFGLIWFAMLTLVIFVTMWLWNWLIPQLFHGPVITFWQSAGLLLLSKILFSGLGHRPDRRFHRKRGNVNEPDWWKNYKDRFRKKSNTENAI